MATCTETQAKPKYILELSKEEAIYLKGITQNCMCHPLDEPSEHADIRDEIYISLSDVLNTSIPAPIAPGIPQEDDLPF